jgi:hypothetical protein
MSRSQDSDASEDDATPKMTRFQKLRYSMVKPDDPDDGSSDEPELSVEELEALIARADDRERAVGLVAAPVAAIVGLIISGDLINHAKSLGQSTSVYQTLTFVMLGTSVAILGTAWFRKRLFLGLAMALYGLSVFNLHGYGFAIPFVLGGAWFIVRAYRLQTKLKLATGDGPQARRRSGYVRPEGVLPRPNKRYTPRTAPAKRPAKPKPEID